MKKLQTRVLALVMAMAMVLGLSGMAMAADPAPIAPKPISVQLDGKNLAFTDAVPQVKDQRTFLPFRAVFEAMGAEVDYSASANTVTAKRDGTTVTMALGGTTATVEKDGAKTEIAMDVAPFAENNRTYVPVRFAAQAFGCAVGWDQDAQTAVIVDVEKLVDDTTADYHFTYLDKYMDYSKQFSQGTWAVTGKLDGKLTLALAEGEKPQELMTINATYDGLSAAGTKTQMSMNLKMDMAGLLKMLSEAAGQSPALTADEQALFDELKTNGISMDVRGDLTAGMLYMSLSGKLMEVLGLSKDTWFSIDFNSLFEGTGLDMNALMSAAQNFDLDAMLKQALPSVAVNDSATAYAETKATVEQIVKFLADESFVKNGNDYTTSLKAAVSGDEAGISLTLTMKNDKVVGYKTEMSAATTVESTGAMTMKMSASMDADNKLSAVITMDMGELGSLEMTMTGAYTTSTKTPETEPPAGAAIVPLEDLMGGAAPEA